MMIRIEKNINIKKLLEEWQEIFTDEERMLKFDARNWEVITSTCMALQEYYLRYGDMK